MQKINKETADLNNTINQLDLKDIYINKSPTTRAEYIFFSNAHETFSRINHILGHKRSLNKSKEIEIIQSIFYNQNEKKLEINDKRKFGRIANMWKLSNYS